MNCKKSYTTLLTSRWGGAAAVFLGLALGTKAELAGSIVAGIGLIAMLGGAAQAFLFYKCPECGRRLNIRARKPDYCPGCGHPFDR